MTEEHSRGNNIAAMLDSTTLSGMIKWSSSGFIAYTLPVLQSKENIRLTYLENVDGKSWQLSKNRGFSIKLDNNYTPEISAMEWSSLNTDLAVTDNFGNFFILLAGVLKNGSNNDHLKAPSSNGASYEITSYNHLEMIYRNIVNSSPSSHLSTPEKVVVFKWLSINKSSIVNKPAQFAGPNQSNYPSTSLAYNYSVSQFHHEFAAHPINTKQACLALRQNGDLILFYQDEHKVDYFSVETKASKVPVYITKASIGLAERRSIIITAYDSLSKNIITYEASIDWGYLNDSSVKQKSDPYFHTNPEEKKGPFLTIKKIHTMEPISIQLDPREDEAKAGDVNNDTKDIQVRSSQLMSIDCISPNYQENSSFNVLISYVVDNDQDQEVSVIYRYELKPYSKLLSSAFEELGSLKEVSNGDEPLYQTMTYSLCDRITRPGRLQSIESKHHDSLLVFIYNDGRMDFIDRESLKIVNENISDNQNLPPTLRSVFDAGFEFSPLDFTQPSLITISPNLCSVVYLNTASDQTQPNINVAKKSKFMEISPKDLFLTAAGFAFNHAYSCYSNSSSDDLLLMIEIEIQRVMHLLNKSAPEKTSSFIKKFIGSIACESHKAMNFNLDAFGKDSVDKLLSSPPLQKLLSLQLVLGEISGYKLISDIAWVVLNLRSSSFGIMFSLSNIYRQISKRKPEETLEDSTNRGECIMSLVGNIKWLIDLMIYLNQELIQLAYSKDDPSNSILTIENSVALPLLLSKVPRLFLMYGLSSVIKSNEILVKLQKELSNKNELFTPMRSSLNRFFTVFNDSPLTLSFFEGFLRESDSFVSSELESLKTANGIKIQSLKTEQKIICQAVIPDEMVPLAGKLVERHNAIVSRDPKLSRIYFADVSWIDVGCRTFHTCTGIDDINPLVRLESQPTDKLNPRSFFLDTKCVDGLRKIVISLTGNEKNSLRRCPRCRSVSLLTDPAVFDYKGSRGLWTMVFQRTCLCGSAWVNY